MKKINNYNKSSEENSISISCFYDTGSSEQYFDDFSRYGISDELPQTERLTNDSFLLYNKFENYTLNVTEENEDVLRYYLITNGEKIGDNVTINNSDLIDLIKSDSPEIVKNLLYRYVSRGHSQGDRVKILTTKELKPTENTWINRLFWEAPFYLVVNVDGEDFFLDEDVEDAYNYDRNEIVDILHKKYVNVLSDYALKFIEDNLPEYPEYD